MVRQDFSRPSPPSRGQSPARRRFRPGAALSLPGEPGRTRALSLGGAAVLLAAFFAGVVAAPAPAHHVSLRPGFFGHVVVDLALSPREPKALFVLAFGRGVFASADGGRSWRKLNEGLTDLSVRTLAFYPGSSPKGPLVSLLLGTDGGAFRRSGGGPWGALPGLRARSVRVFQVGPGSPPALFAGTEGGVFASPDGGRTWEGRNEGLTSPDVRALALDPGRPGRLYAGTFGGVFRSEDGGRSWRGASAGLSDPRVRALALDPESSLRLFAGTAGGGVFESRDGGGTWRPANEQLGDTSVMALAFAGGPRGALYAGTRGGLFRLPGAGGPWEYVRVERALLSVPALAAGPEGWLFVASGGEVYRSRDGGRSWHRVSPGRAPEGFRGQP